MKRQGPQDRARRRIVAGLAALALPRVAPAAEWKVEAPEARGLPAAAVEDVLSDAGSVTALRALLVARGGALVAERYYGAALPQQGRRINSATKSVVSLLVGQALAAGKLQGLDQTVAELLPEAAARAPRAPAAGVTLRQILTGTSGLAYDLARDVRALMDAADPVQYVLALPRSEAPAGSWAYNDAAISLLAPILERAHGRKLAEVAREGLFEPLGIDAFRWQADRTGHLFAYTGLELRPRDFLAIASLVAQGGAGIVPPAWLAESLQPHAPGAWPLPPVADSSYGYLWFNGRLHGRPVAWAWGYGAQFALVVPSQQLAIVTLAQEPPPQALSAQNRAVAALAARIVEAAG